MVNIVPEEHREAAAKMRDILSIYAKNEDLISIGAYKSGTNPRLDKAVSKIDRVNEFLMQKINESFSGEESLKMMREIVR
jgi:flagellum-specific ATP synthase